MIGLIVLALAAAWLFFSAKAAIYVASRFRPRVLSSVVGALTFLLLAVLPVLDELVGRWQFKLLCKVEAVTWVSPNAHKVVAAKRVSRDGHRHELVFPVLEQSTEYVDLESGDVFYSFKAFHTPGGLLMQAGLGLGHSTSCWPDKWMSRDFGLDIEKLVKRGAQ